MSSLELDPGLDREWLETDGLGGYASGTVALVRTRRYHALLLAATTPPTGRVALVAAFDAALERGGRREWISSQRYAPGVLAPERSVALEAFEAEPWPTWRYRLASGELLEQSIRTLPGAPRVLVAWRLSDARGHPVAARLVLRPYLAGRDDHDLGCAAEARARLLAEPIREGAGLRFATGPESTSVVMRTHPATIYRHEPHWYRNVLLEEERARGFSALEDLASPGELTLALDDGEAFWLIEAVASDMSASADSANGVEPFDPRALVAAEHVRRARFATALDRAADAYVVQRGAGHTIVAGYPWFSDWGRDTFIALRGLCLATGRFGAARDILLEWAGTIDEGMLPNRFPDRGERPEFNAVDASLWFVVAVEAYLAACERGAARIEHAERDRLIGAVDGLLAGYTRGTRYGIHLDRDGLLAAGVPGVQLTWMDARVDGREVTPRIGKPVEVQALWWNSLRAASAWDSRWRRLAERARQAFADRFWNPDRGCLYDVVDVDHVPGAVDPRLRPNQLFAVGGLPGAVLEGARAERVVEVCEAALWTPVGLRTLGRDEPGYVPRYAGGPAERDAAYHQGTVWPWLAGAFVEAWVRVRGSTPAAKRTARDRFFAPLRERLGIAGFGHLSEVADAEPAHRPGGCPFQAWSLAELIRLDREILTD